MTHEEHRERIEYGVMGLCKALREHDQREGLRHSANLIADLVTAFVRLERNIGRIADALEAKNLI